MVSYDPCSLSNVEHFTATNLEWTINANFKEKILECVAKTTFQCVKQDAQELVLDSALLSIENPATVEWGDGHKMAVDVTKDSIIEEKKYLGEALHIPLTAELCKVGQTFDVTIKYKTSPEASAIQWLNKEQTEGKNHPYLFTQCQAIHARSLVPCQDSPGKKIKYTANVTVPKELVAVMSALTENEEESGDSKVYRFNQPTAVPSYLLALAIGKLESREIPNDTKPKVKTSVWCEDFFVEDNRKYIDVCAEEFSQVGDMVQAAIDLMGDYQWGKYDLLILPRSFPYGGMENPCITFATPTIVAGDKSLTSVVAHEISHSWTGNLVTNSNWEHFWLNEGFTRFMEEKIMEKIVSKKEGELKGKQFRSFQSIIGWSALVDSVNRYKKINKMDFTKLVPDLSSDDPDDAFSSIPYEKGYTFLYYIENKILNGPDEFNPFLKAYIKNFSFGKVQTNDFKNYLENYFKDTPSYEKIKQIDWKLWLEGEGISDLMIETKNSYDHTLAQQCIDLANRWENATDDTTFDASEFKSLETLQKVDFLSRLYQDALQDESKKLSLSMTKKLANTYGLRKIENSEIKSGFHRLAIRAMWDDVVYIGQEGSTTLDFITSVGRMKFVRPLYRMLFWSEKDEYKQKGKETFLRHENTFYHTICAEMVRRDAKEAGVITE